MCVGGGIGVDYREIPFTGSGESDKKLYWFSGKVLIITDYSQTKLALLLAEMCEVENVSFQKCPSHTSQDTQNKLHSSSSNLPYLLTEKNTRIIFSEWL